MPKEEAGSAAQEDDDMTDPDVMADVMADPEFLQQVNLLHFRQIICLLLYL